MRVSLLRFKDEGVVLSWLFNVYVDRVMKDVTIFLRRRRVRFSEEGSEWGWVDNEILCGGRKRI